MPHKDARISQREILRFVLAAPLSRQLSRLRLLAEAGSALTDHAGAASSDFVVAYAWYL